MIKGIRINVEGKWPISVLKYIRQSTGQDKVDKYNTDFT